MKKPNALYNPLDQEQSQHKQSQRKQSHQEQHRQENPYARRSRSRQESGVVTRAFLVIALSLTLVGVLRWALNVTNANARQISSNLTRLQGHYDSQEQSRSLPNNTGFHDKDTSSIRPSRDPVIEPETR